MEFGILGPLEVADQGQPIDLDAPKPRALLGRLLIDVNHVVAADRLIEDLWEGAPPRSAVTTLQTYVSQLRKIGMTSLRTRPTGYVLQVAPETVDAAQFERILLDVRARDDSPERTATRLTEALSLWRGPAFSDFVDATWARLEAARLESLRVDALGDAFDARLTLGQHRALVSDLEMLVGTHAFYERFWSQLMLALYRTGRQADALRAYARLRTRLREELGIDPSAELTRLEESILLQKPELDWHPLNERQRRPPGAGHPSTARLEIADSEDDPVVPLSGERLTIGRSRANDIALLSDQGVSRVHALVERLGSAWCLRDLGSRNGTSVNGERLVTARALRNGDHIAIGSWSAVFRDDRDNESAITTIT